MPKLIVMRHAHAPYKTDSDFDRQLSNEGMSQASKARNFLLKNYNLDTIITSPAPRAMQTASYIENAFSIKAKQYEFLYSGTLSEIINSIKVNGDTLIIAHNPTIIEFAKKICDDNSLFLNREHFIKMSSAKMMIFEYQNPEQLINSCKFIKSVEFE